MTVLIAILTVGLVAVTVLVVSAPVRARRRAADSLARDGSPAQTAGPASDGPRVDASAAAGRLALREQLEVAREAKYREIRDAELDYRTGKLSRADHDDLDRELRAEALEILNRLEAAEAEVARSSTAPTPRGP